MRFRNLLFGMMFPMLCYAQDSLRFTAGYNALEAAIRQDQTASYRMYTNIGISFKGFSAKVSGLNETGRDTENNTYFFGRETFRIGNKIFPADLIYTKRVYGKNLDDARELNGGFGVRLTDLKLNMGDAEIISSGWADLIKHASNKFNGLEAIISVEKSFRDYLIDPTIMIKDNGWKYLELQLLTPPIRSFVNFRAFMLGEYENKQTPNYLIGIQASL